MENFINKEPIICEQLRSNFFTLDHMHTIKNGLYIVTGDKRYIGHFYYIVRIHSRGSSLFSSPASPVSDRIWEIDYSLERGNIRLIYNDRDVSKELFLDFIKKDDAISCDITFLLFHPEIFEGKYYAQ